MISQSADARETSETSLGLKFPISPVSQLIANNTVPPIESWMPESRIADAWLDMLRDKIVPADHDKAAASSQTTGRILMPACSTFCHATSPTPKKPGTRASRAKGFGR